MYTERFWDICAKYSQCNLNISTLKPCITQTLPCNLDHIEATPVLKEDHTRGVLVNRFDIMYEAFDNKVASGNEHL